MKLIKTLLIAVILFACVDTFAQYSHKTVTYPETTASDSFSVPNRHWFSGIQFPEGLLATMDSMYFLVSCDLSLGFDTLRYNGAKYFESTPTDLSPFAITLKIPATFTWEWWKICFRETLTDSITFYPVFDEVKK